MPVTPDCPEPLRTALTEMENVAQATKKSLAYAAPEMQDSFWADLQEDLAGIIEKAVFYMQDE